MTYEELEPLFDGLNPVRLKSGMGFLIRLRKEKPECAVQLPGAEDIQWIDASVLEHHGGGVLTEQGSQRIGAHMADTRLTQSRCPKCGEGLDAATGVAIGEPGQHGSEVERPTPYPGAVSICGYCAALLVFDGCLIPRLPTPEQEQDILGSNPLIRLMRDDWIRKKRGEV